MINLFKKFIKNKYFIIWVLFFLLILYFTFNPLMYDKTNYMNIKNITDYRYLYYVFLLPMSFYDMGFVSCIILELSCFSIVSYICVSFVNLFFKETSSVTITRLGRERWIKEVININLIFSIIVSIIYISFFYLLCIKNNIDIKASFDMLIPIIYKIIIICIIPLVFINTFIKTNSEVSSILISLITDLFLQLVIRITFIEETLIFNYYFIIIILFLLFYYLMKRFSISIFKRRDV